MLSCLLCRDISLGINGKPVCNLLLVNTTNFYSPVLHHLQVTAGVSLLNTLVWGKLLH